ncbi:hypothetical protein MES4922_280019 [Mesorhizobium ventifaucium]|uniref:Propionyl-coenzyme A carboxylase alpha polypeptide n=1 Tax=Mesorhizobium ventifaucium TaxID=666020 RepID=A0ABM9DXS8_9HYPH|nr:hypothetical protein MES4922_280019 [Mesorhizobium ventifaucium]
MAFPVSACTMTSAYRGQGELERGPGSEFPPLGDAGLHSRLGAFAACGVGRHHYARPDHCGPVEARGAR